MANLKELADEMAKLKKQFETVLSVSDYYNCEDLSGLDDYISFFEIIVNIFSFTLKANYDIVFSWR